MQKSGLRTYGLGLGLALLLIVIIVIAYKVRQSELEYTGSSDFGEDIAIMVGKIKEDATDPSASDVRFGMAGAHASVSGITSVATVNISPQATEAVGSSHAAYRNVSESDEHSSTGNVPNLEYAVDVEAEGALPGSATAAKTIAKTIAESVSAAAGR